MKILIDMNLSPDWVQVFENSGIKSVHWSNIGDPRATDRVIMNWASANGYIVFTNDLDFGSLLAATQAEAPSVIQVRTQDLLPATIGNVVVEALRRFASELESGALITIDLTRSRVRILPIILPAKE
ncbi:MAG TPA: hypothetical protein DEG17_22565 [Cyanobacteria bacterium UBA11149]|nr:hypothetical protein [Cyanobacteria bacterium UBA11367]HBE57162.1 hypothetical protein [Cyanobacteria bacterium UBA11366]HBK62578.1 hypothetical protein [Cyanobacteria bacterium UBA11166]HBR72853.1 hypothetical protein [Cyanobacteria bacterium UBA11159]HBS67817.1 hypothetical protein [Cyanobacteria bacterium UBA11153]HBW91565.1 hypothetical protein [Cyanobacteria bacterium UBA11149]HCA93323.1 hypothetical protein [Cyanobacteria bacterium UBA9226]